jgi:hypothetical protein
MSALRLGFALVLWMALSSRSLAQDASDLGFEAGQIGRPPAGWIVPAPGWKAELTDENAAVGSRCVKLFKPGSSSAPFGNLMLARPADGLAGKHVTLTAKIYVTGQGRGQMWLRVDRKDDSMGAFDNMGDRPILPGGWRNAKIEADIEPDAALINVGFIAIGEAMLYIDDVKLSLSAARQSMQDASPPRALTPRGLANVTAAAKLLSYLRLLSVNWVVL